MVKQRNSKDAANSLDGTAISAISYQKAALSRIENLYKELKTSENGITEDEARQRLLHYGPNVPTAAKKTGFAQRLILQMKNWFNILLIVASALSFFSGIVYNDYGSLQMGAALFGVVIVNAFFSLIQEHRAEKAVQAISRLIPKKAKVVRDNNVRQIDVSEIVPGDMIMLEEGDEVPADARLVSAFEVSVNNSPLTGESGSQHRSATAVHDDDSHNPTELQNILFAGTTVVTGVAKGIVLYTGASTEIGRVVSLSGQIIEPPSALEREINNTAKLNLIIAIVIAAFFFGITLLFVGLTVTNSILFAIGILISLVPEGMQLTVSLSLALTAFNMSKRNVVVKRLSSVETLGSMTVLCVDKTGTMTSGEMMVEKAWTGGKVFQVSGDGYNPLGLITVSDRRPDSNERTHMSKLFEVAAFCNNAKLNPPGDNAGRWTVLGDTTDGAFLVFAVKGGFNIQQAAEENPRVHIIPFSSKRRLMTTIHKGPDGALTSYTKGSCRELLDRCTHILFEGRITQLTPEMCNTVIRQMDDFASQGYRVLALANRKLEHNLHEKLRETAVDVEKDMTFLGMAALADPPRPMMKDAVSEALRAGIRVIMLTGDYEITAKAVARKIGIVSSANPMIVTGHELSMMSESEVSRVLDKKEVIFARTLPEQKLMIVKSLMSKGEIVGVTGDGVNDSPALLEANVGVAMGIGGTDVARESADIILLDNNFASIVEGIRHGRAVFENLRRFVGYLFTHNFAELGAFVAFVLLGVPLPLAVMQVLAIDLGMDVIPSLSLIMEKPEDGIMEKPPRKSNRLFDINVMSKSLYLGATVSIAVLLYAFTIWGGSGWSLGQRSVGDPVAYAKGTTAVMIGIMGAQLGNLFAVRTSKKSALKLSPFRNKWLFIGILSQIAIMAAIVYVPFLQPIFGTAALSKTDLLFLYVLGPAVFFLEELRKLVARRISNKTIEI